MRNAVLVVPAVIAVLLAGWLIDDKLVGGDVPRNTSIGGVDIGGLSRDEAAQRLNDGRLIGRQISLTHQEAELSTTAADLGVSVTIEDALDLATERPSLPLQPFSWLASVVTGPNHTPDYSIDSEELSAFLAEHSEELLDLDFGQPPIELVDGELAEGDRATAPAVDLDALESMILDAVRSGGDSLTVELPIGGPEAVDRGGAAALIATANDLTERGIYLQVVGERRQVFVPAATLREWLVFTGPAEEPGLTLDRGQVQSTVESLFVTYGESGIEPGFEIDALGRVQIVGSSPGAVCCDAESAQRILDALEAGENLALLNPIEDPDVRGIEWAESLGVVELIGEFTTEYQAGQSRVTNIQRIAELTQGALIEPGGEFSVNDFVGVRTREKGFVAAGVISNGVFRNSVGGGISQYATTLFNAAFFAGLDFGEYQSHSIYISRYPYGREATVSHPHPDLEIINSTPYGVLIWPTTTDTSITVQLYSTRWVEGEQTGQSERREGVACTRVTTERTRTWIEDGRTETDSVTARYRPEGVRCDGRSSVPTTAPPTTTEVPPSTTVP